VTVDADGFVWNCKWNGGRIVRYDRMERSTGVCTCRCPDRPPCAFVGPTSHSSP